MTPHAREIVAAGRYGNGRNRRAHPNGRNPGDVWSVPTRPYTGPRFAAFPIELPLRCIAAGAEAKFWLEDPGTGQRWLFKSVTIKNDHVHGEDWAEKAASHLARLLGIPCAEVEMAVREGEKGSIVANLRPASYQMQPGQVVLESCDAPGYIHRNKGKDHPGHTLENIRDALREDRPPPGCTLPFDASAFDVFAGYVLFDAWIANQDRHDNNWSVFTPWTATVSPRLLSGSYDHASSLAFGEPDSKRQMLLSRPDGVATWCARGKASRFEGRPKLAEAAYTALQLASPEAREYWLEATTPG